LQRKAKAGVPTKPPPFTERNKKCLWLADSINPPREGPEAKGIYCLCQGLLALEN
jgi:hypothetical protein